MKFLPLAIFLLMAMVTPPAAAATYYISATGNDTNPGTSSQQAWASISKVNESIFAPGDLILFEGGAEFKGSIYFDEQTRGTAANPITISSYGTGRAIISSGTMGGLMVYNSAGFKVKNLVFKGAGRTQNTSSGIFFYMDLESTRLDYILIDSVEVYGYQGSGILIGSENKASGFDNIAITNSEVHDNGDNGISSYSQARLGHRNMYVAYNKVYNHSGIPERTDSHSGSGIMLGGVDGGIIEYCEAYNNGWLNAWKSGGPVGIWAWHCNNLIIQYNESHHNKTGTTKDGGGFDIDGGSTNCIMQYNYSHDNDGAGYLIAQYNNAPAMKNITIRYNISENDGRKNGYGGIHLWSSGANGGIQNAQVYNNTVYMSPAGSGAPKAVYIQQGGKTIATFRNNILQTTGGVQLLSGETTADVRFEGNNYWATGSTPKITWAGVTYTSLDAWRAATGQERYNGSATGLSEDPQLKNPGKGITLSDPTKLYTFSNYELKSTSKLIGMGIDLATELGIDAGKTDLWGNSILQRQDLCIGAHQYTKSSKVCLYGGLQKLTFGSATGGMYSGPGITTSQYFNPEMAGTGNHALQYSYTDAQGQPQLVHHTIIVLDASSSEWTGSNATADWFDSYNWSTCTPTPSIHATVPTASVTPIIKSGETALVKDLGGTGTIRVEQGGTVAVSGNLSAPNIRVAPLATLLFNSNSSQTIPSGTYGRLVLQGTGRKILTGPVTILQELNLEQSGLHLNNYDLCIEGTASIKNYSSHRYIVTNGSGKLVYKAVGKTTSRIYPIGTSQSYTPATLQNNGEAGSYGMYVQNSTWVQDGQNETASENAVDRTWFVESRSIEGNNIDLKLQWNIADELPAFERSESFISYYENGEWKSAKVTTGAPEQGTAENSYTISLSGITTFQAFSVRSNSQSTPVLLPVTLSGFKAVRQGADVLLEWQTASEKNNFGFGVEVSADGKQFRSLGFVSSKSSDSDQVQYYSFRDIEAAKAGTRYYRLRQTDKDGSTAYSFVKSIRFDDMQLVKATAYPNPFSNSTTLDVPLTESGTVEISVSDSQGRLLLKRFENLSLGANKLQLELNEKYRPGLYLITVQHAGQTQLLKVIKR